MKKLYLLRHAKASHPAGLDDKNRPLSPQGRQTCIAMAEYLTQNDIAPDLILCSDSLRTKQTAEGVFQHNNNLNIEYNKKLYLATPGEIIKEINKTQENVNSIMVIAHNPGIQQICSILASSGDAEILKSIKNDYPTCALAEFSLNIVSWKSIEPRVGKLENFVIAKEL